MLYVTAVELSLKAHISFTYTRAPFAILYFITPVRTNHHFHDPESPAMETAAVAGPGFMSAPPNHESGYASLLAWMTLWV